MSATIIKSSTLKCRRCLCQQIRRIGVVPQVRHQIGNLETGLPLAKNWDVGRFQQSALYPWSSPAVVLLNGSKRKPICTLWRRIQVCFGSNRKPIFFKTCNCREKVVANFVIAKVVAKFCSCKAVAKFANWLSVANGLLILQRQNLRLQNPGFSDHKIRSYIRSQILFASGNKASTIAFCSRKRIFFTSDTNRGPLGESKSNFV